MIVLSPKLNNLDVTKKIHASNIPIIFLRSRLKTLDWYNRNIITIYIIHITNNIRFMLNDFLKEICIKQNSFISKLI